MPRKRPSSDPNLQLYRSFLFWIRVECIVGHQYCEENIELLISFCNCIHDCDNLDLIVRQNDLDTLLAHSGFFPELERDNIVWHGIGLRFNYWDPKKTESPFLDYPKIYDYPD